MAATPDNSGHELKRIVLPSGKTIEVVYFPSVGAKDEVEAEQVREVERREAQQAGLPADELHLCRECESDLVFPISWEEAGPDHWEVDLRCPNCEWSGTGTWSQDVVEEFDEELDRGTEVLAEDYKRLVTANMAEDIERFAEALGADAILPEDF